MQRSHPTRKAYSTLAATKIDDLITALRYPDGNTTTARVQKITATSSGITGSLTSGSATADIDLPNGSSQLIATTTFNVTADTGKDYSGYAMGEPVKEVKISHTHGGGSVAIFITVSGNEYSWPVN